MWPSYGSLLPGLCRGKNSRRCDRTGAVVEETDFSPIWMPSNPRSPKPMIVELQQPRPPMPPETLLQAGRLGASYDVAVVSDNPYSESASTVVPTSFLQVDRARSGVSSTLCLKLQCHGWRTGFVSAIRYHQRLVKIQVSLGSGMFYPCGLQQ
jgi:hypothetical protein